MHKIDTDGATAQNEFTDGDPQGGTPATVVDDDWLNAVQEELVNPIEDSGITLAKGTNNQLLQAIAVIAGRLAGYRNLLINGDFRVWQRGTSHALSAENAYTADRWNASTGASPGAATISRQAFTPGQTDVEGEPEFFGRFQQTAGSGGGAAPLFSQAIEEVRTFAGQKVAVSFYARVSAGTLQVTPRMIQSFGSGGSADVTTSGTAITVDTTWTRFEQVFTLPTISGKTLGAESYLALQLGFPTGTTFTLDVAQIQVVPGDIAGDFRSRPLAAELQLCHRFYEKSYETGTDPGSNTGLGLASGHEPGTIAQSLNTRFRAEKAKIPTITWYTEAGTSGKIDWESAERTVTQTNNTSRAWTGAPEVGTSRADSVVQAHWVAEAEF